MPEGDAPNASAADALASTPVPDLVPAVPVASPERPLPRWARTFRSLRHRNYRLYFLGQIVSLTGSWIQTTALAWLSYEMTGQSLWPALISAAGVLPTFLLGALGGALADRWPKRPLLITTQTIFLVLALALAGLVLTGHITPWQMLVVTLGS